MTLPETETQEPPNPFDVFDSIGQTLGFIFKKLGEDGLRKLLAMPGVGGSNRELFEDAADELRTVGLGAAAAIVSEFAEKLSPEVEVCPHDPNSANGRAWMQSYRNRQWERQWQRRKRRAKSALHPEHDLDG